MGALISIGFGYFLLSPAEKDGCHDQIFLVRNGDTLKKIASNLEQAKIIAGKTPFLLWARLIGHDRDIKAGEYRLTAAMPPVKILDILIKGIIISYPVTIPEGFTAKQIGDLLEEKNLANKTGFLSLTKGPDIARQYGIACSSLEGFLYPDTYHFSRSLSSMDIIDVMVNHFFNIFSQFREMVDQSDMKMEEIITLASIVEKETGHAEERPIIASVFLNRLKKKMRLESDPTVIYGLKNFNGNLTKKDLTQGTPYNTYVIHGLPPGPIANPGLEAIKAVLYPSKTDYLYFVSKNDGSHYFSKTLSEHNRAVRIYQKKRMAGTRKRF